MLESYNSKPILGGKSNNLLTKKTGTRNLKQFLFTAIMIFMMGFTQNIRAQPSTGGCGYAGTGITVGTSCVNSTMNSNANTDYWNSATGCNGADIDDVWWWFTATATSTTITYSSSNDAVLHVFTGACATTMLALTCADAGSSGDETINLTTVVGQKYAVRAQRYNSNTSMNGSLCVYSSQYKAKYFSMNTGSTSWCPGETRNVVVTIQNDGSSSWTDGGGEDFNIGVKWNADADYFVRVDAQNLAPGASKAYTLAITAPNTPGAENLNFNVVREGVAWFGGSYASPTITINTPPTSPNAGSDVTICAGTSTNLSGSATGPSVATTGSRTFNYSGSGYDYYNFTVGGTTSGMPAGAIITSVNLTYSTGNSCSWSNVDLYINNGYINSYCSGSGTYNGLNGAAANGQKFEIDSYDEDGWSDYITMTLAVTVNYSYSTTAAVTYAWTPAGTLNNAVIANPIATPPTTTNYTMTATSNGCSVTDTVKVTVNSLSTSPTLSGTNTICPGGSTTLSASGGTMGTGAEDTWYQGGCASEAFTQEWVTQPYGAPNTVTNSVSGGILNVTSTSNDPMLDMSGLGSFDPNIYRYINIRYRVTAGTASNVEIFFYNSLAHNYAVGGETGYGTLISDNTWRTLSVDMWTDPDYKTGGNILGWRFDWTTNSGVTMDIDYITLADEPIIGTGTSITVSPTTTTTYYASRKGECNTSSCASRTVTVKSAAANIVLATTTVLSAIEQCVDTGWTYYADPSDATKWLFAIFKNGNSFSPTVDITVKSASPVEYDLKADPTNFKAAFTMGRYWNVASGVITGSNPMKVRFFAKASDITTMESAANAWAAANPCSIPGYTTKVGVWEWFKTVNTPYNPSSMTASGTHTASDSLLKFAAVYGKINGIDYMQYDGVTSFSGGTVGIQVFPVPLGDPSVPLPVKMTSFTARPIEDRFIKLDWSTSLEIDNKEFLVGRSEDGKSFSILGKVSGNGTTTRVQNYSFEDHTALADVVYYYQLEQVDYDEKINFSHIVSATFGSQRSKGSPSIAIFPNPVSSFETPQLVLNGYNNKKVKISVFNLLGQKISDQEVVVTQNKFTTDIFIPEGSGTYMVHVESGIEKGSIKLVTIK